MSKNNLTLKDIAEEAGVSLTAASLYINGKARQYNLSESTCDRIKKVIKSHNFVPNIHARAIASKKTFLVGVVLSQELEASFWLNIISSLEEELSGANYHLLLSVSHGRKESERDSIDFMRSKGIDGLIISPIETGGLEDLSRELPIVTLNLGIENVPGVWNDNFHGGRLATDYLLDNGHRRIAAIGSVGIQRAIAYCDRLNQSQITPHIFPSVKDFMLQADQFTAVFCFNDYLMLELYQATAAAGIDIPNDLSVIGYDNMDFVKFLSPRPSTIAQYKNELGSAAGQLILQLIDGKRDVNRQIVFTPKLISGKSVKKMT
ncbi:MAG: LacI family transcriptional regulator [Victivallales bacterium]|jgi:DNA-binding LacI/PurR family transcriptional regulator|nr:LacI family transcriptional regulator [Victivallales bacterium]